MRAVVMRDRKLVVDEIADPVPGPGEVLVKTLACGICGSDLHALVHADRMAEAGRRSGSPLGMDPDRDVVMGHEFCAEVVDYGPDTQRRFEPGTRVCSMPVALRNGQPVGIGYSNDVTGAYAEYMVLSEMMLLEVPEGLSPDRAALTEPMAVGLHAVERGALDPEDVPLVIGCGPVGLAVIAALRIRGVHPIVASEPSAARRAMATALGADVVVDPNSTSPYEAWARAASGNGPGTPLAPTKPAVIFECVGVPGILQQIIEGAPRSARVVVVGVCMETDQIEPLIAIGKELSLSFVLGYTPAEFSTALDHLARGAIDADPVITGRIGLDEVPAAFEELKSPNLHAKIIVEPWRR